MIVINGKSGVDNEQLLAEIEELFNTKAQSGSHEARYATIASAKKYIPESNLAVIFGQRSVCRSRSASGAAK